ncbi:LytR/AlgR family response regulator transcription factor [Pseudofrankia inefficax]|uniref:Response regulator receiver n=1 Tax=Pseudofrankia inefficax (strain DSM 45817 / CECT 9037 / DDB 130130 / EuI1c) TaxID=298654 RepID=E3J9S1_PSEI1|nr:response regulator [Pseudofrankia inefficax]ADP84574.1 response regulator receiver [Pseudofrankia inefficax]
MPVHCLIVDDSQEFLDAATRLLEAQGLTVVGRSRTGADALELVDALAPDVVLVDVELGDEDGIGVAGRLAAHPASPTVILISSHDRQALRELVPSDSGLGFLTKQDLTAEAITRLLS